MLLLSKINRGNVIPNFTEVIIVLVEADEQDYTSIILGSTTLCVVLVILFIVLYVYKKKRNIKK